MPQERDVTVLGVFDDPGVAKYVTNSLNRYSAVYMHRIFLFMYLCWGLYPHGISSETGTEGPLCLVEAIEPSEYSYFAPAVLASWAGPLHWKINNKQSAHLKKGTLQYTPVR